jgi:hypothetical protein
MPIRVVSTSSGAWSIRSGGWRSSNRKRGKMDGTIIWVSEDARAVRDAAGSVLFYEGIVEDITARKAAEAELARLNKELIEASRAAGMAEVATGVLHNVGNVLNSVNLGVARVARAARGHAAHASAQGRGPVRAASARSAGVSSARRRRGRPFRDSSQAHAASRGGEPADARRSRLLVEHVDHIKQIVSMQQSYARVFGVIETLRPGHLVEMRSGSTRTATPGIA